MIIGISEHARRTPDKPALVLGRRVGPSRASTSAPPGSPTRSKRAASAPTTGSPIMLPNSIEFFEVWAAASKLAAPVVLVNWHLKRDELDLHPRGLRGQAPGRPRRPARVRRARGPGHRLRAAPGRPGRRLRGRGRGRLRPSPPLELVALAVADLLHLGDDRPAQGRGPRPARSRAKADQATLGQIALWGWTADDVYILTGPAYHAGPGGWAMAALAVGATTVILPTFDAREWFRLVAPAPASRARSRCRRTSSACSRCREDERRRYDLSSLRLIVHAGAPCPIPVKHRIIEALAPCEIAELYGMSEGGATRISMAEWLARPGSVGTPWPGVEVKILDELGDEVPDGRPPDSSTCARRAARGSTTTTTTRRRRARGATTPSPWATSATSTPTATCSSPTGPPTW